MDSFDFNGVTDEKKSSSTMECPYNRILSLARLFRFAELCFALLLLSWIFTKLPLAGDYFRRVSDVFASPLFVFLLCHVIVASIMANSGRFSRQNNQSLNDDTTTESEIYEKMATNSPDSTIDLPSEEIVFEDKKVISEGNTKTAIKADHRAYTDHSDRTDESDSDSDLPRFLRRWQSENFGRGCSDEDRYDQLRRWGSEKCLDIVVSGHERHHVENSFSHDKLSDDDFNRTVEAFIAKQLKFRRQEDGYRAVGLYYGDDLGYEKKEV